MLHFFWNTGDFRDQKNCLTPAYTNFPIPLLEIPILLSFNHKYSLCLDKLMHVQSDIAFHCIILLGYKYGIQNSTPTMLPAFFLTHHLH